MCSRRAIWKSSKLWAAAVVVAASLPAGAQSWQDLGISGSLRGAAWDRDKSFTDDRGYAVGGAWLQARPAEVLGVKTYFDGYVQGEDFTRSQHSRGDLREAYAETSFGNLDLKVGRQITVWGRADKVNPTDVWSVRDFTLLTSDDEDQRTGLFATQLAWTSGNYRVIGVWQPEWRPPVIPLGNLPPEIALGNGNPRNKSEQWGLKLDHSGDEWDWSLSYASVIDRMPDFKVRSAGAGGTDLELNYQTIRMYGADFAKTFGSYGLRGELAYVRTEDRDGQDSATKNPYLYGVLGVERTFFGDLNINAQYIYRYAYHWRDTDEIADSDERQIAEQVDILSNQRAAHFHAGSLRVNYKMLNETLDAEVAVAGWFNNGFLRPKLNYAVTDQWRLIMGAELYVGDSNTFFGRLRDLSSGFLEVRYLF